MKKVQVSARILRCSPLANADGSPVYRRNRHITHRLILASSPSFEQAIKMADALPRLSEDEVNKLNAEGKTQYSTNPASFCLKQQGGNYALDLDINQMRLLTGGRMTPEQFQFVAPHTTFNATVELRSVGDVVINARTKEEREIVQAHASLGDITSALAPAVEGAIINAMFAPTKPAYVLSAPPANLPTIAGSDDEPDMQSKSDKPEIQIGAEEEEAPIANAKQGKGKAKVS